MKLTWHEMKAMAAPSKPICSCSTNSQKKKGEAARVTAATAMAGLTALCAWRYLRMHSIVVVRNRHGIHRNRYLYSHMTVT